MIQSKHNYRAFLEYEDVDTCPLCDCVTSCLRFQPDVMQCTSCRLMYRSPCPTQAEIIRSYDAGINYSQWQNELDIRDFLWRKRLALLEKHKSSGVLLDMGTGDGFFLKYAATRYEVHSTEISETGAAYARERGFFPSVGDFLDIEIAEGSFDIVTLWHVLEHLRYPGAVLQKIKAVLKPGGIVAVAVPNERYQLTFNHGRQNPLDPMYWGAEIHLTHFLPQTLKDFLTRSNFKILEFGVDDVHVSRPLSTRICFHTNRLLNALTGWHFDKAMYIICMHSP